MQPNPPRRRRAPARRINGHLARWGPYVRLTLMLIVAATAIFAGRDHWRFSRSQHDPFPPRVSGSGRPIDGDSLWVEGNEVRLQGIDAPEGRQTCWRAGEVWKCGEDAYLALVRDIGGETVTCDITQRDVYGRLLAHCVVGGRDLNAGMVAAGMAVAYGAYYAEEAAARAAKRGLWAGEFDRPDKWRAENKIK